MNERRLRMLRMSVVLCGLVLSGCAARSWAVTGSVATAWQERDQRNAASATTSRDRSPRIVTNRPQQVPPNEAVIATVNGRPIPRARMVDLLLRSRGSEVLEQLIGLETAQMAASERGLTISRADVDREARRALRRLADPLSSVTPDQFDRRAAERLLDTVLAERGMSREEFDIVMRRNAFLRKIVESELALTEEQLREEFRRVYGKRVQVRHIQLATLAEVARVKERLAAGEDFGELAGRYSANVASAASRGLLEPFSAGDEELPALFREVSFSLKPGEISDTTRVGEWYHLIKSEKVLSAQQRDLANVRDELERSLRERVTEPAMFALFENLFLNASIEINDPLLAEAFDKKQARRGR